MVHVSLHSNVHGDSHASTLTIYLTKLEMLEVALSRQDTVRLNVMDEHLEFMGFSCTMLLTSASPHYLYHKSSVLMVKVKKPICLKSF